jgi:hypothetical protein
MREQAVDGGKVDARGPFLLRDFGGFDVGWIGGLVHSGRFSSATFFMLAYLPGHFT